MKLPKFKFGDPIDLTWHDAVNHSGWYSKEYAQIDPPDSICHTRGFYICETKKFISVCNTISEDEVMGLLHIPLSWIVEVN